MNRREIMDGCPEEFEDRLKEIVDHFEGIFNDINQALDIKNLNDLESIVEAADISYKAAGDLY